MSDADRIAGEVVGAYGRHYLVQCSPAGLRLCVPRGRQNPLACGDRVSVAPIAPDRGVIEEAAVRATQLFRSSAHRTKLIAANATQVAVICATSPSFSDELLTRVLIASEDQGMKSLLILNKSDLAEHLEAARQRLAPFELAGYTVVAVSAINDVSPLRPELHGEVTVLVGQSGMGKSTLVNALVPEANRATRDISSFLASGRHTTSNARLYRSGSTALVDCPGLREFGLAHLGWKSIEAAFPEFRRHIGQCRFHDCRHRGEPGCRIKAASESGRIHPRRLELFHRIVDAESRNAPFR